MRIILIISLQLVILFQASPSSAIYGSGAINDDIHFTDLEIIYKEMKYLSYNMLQMKTPSYVTGTLTNRSDKKIHLIATLNFNDNFRRTTATAEIIQDIPAYGESTFKSTIKLVSDDFSDYNLKWDIYTYTHTDTQQPARDKKITEPKSHHAFIRAFESGLQITGSNSFTTEPFRLKKGTSLFTADIVGKNFSASLQNMATNESSPLFSQPEKVTKTEKISIDEAGDYKIQVSAEGSWRILVDFPSGPTSASNAPKTAENKNPSYIIYLKNGKKIIAEQLTRGDKAVTFTTGGIQLSINRDKILRTEKRDQAISNR